MIHPDDVAAWIAQVRQHPEAAPEIIQALAERLLELDAQNEALRDEVIRLGHGSAARDDESVATLTQRVQALERQLERGGLGPPEEVPLALVVSTLDGRGARLSLPDGQVGQGRSGLDFAASHLRPRHLLIAPEEGVLLLLTNKGRAVRIQISDVDSAEPPISYLSLLPDLRLDLDESVTAICPLTDSFDRMTLITRKGYARSFRRAEVESFLERKLALHSSPVAGDYPAFAVLSDGVGELVIATRMGKGVRFPENAVGVQSKPGINLDRGDVVAGAAVVSDDTTLVIVGDAGEAARREMGGFAGHATAGNRGKILTRIEDVAAVAAVNSGDRLWLVTATGRLHSVRATHVPSGPGISRGKRMLSLEEEDRLVALAVGKRAPGQNGE
jgi:DNA gyrase/topoisomerase IV subunit A